MCNSKVMICCGCGKSGRRVSPCADQKAYASSPDCTSDDDRNPISPQWLDKHAVTNPNNFTTVVEAKFCPSCGNKGQNMYSPVELAKLVDKATIDLAGRFELKSVKGDIIMEWIKTDYSPMVDETDVETDVDG